MKRKKTAALVTILFFLFSEVIVCAADSSQKPSHAEIANFRSVRSGTIGRNNLYRSRHPANSVWKSQYANRLMEENHIQTVINLSDTMNILQTFFKGSNPDVSYYYRTLLWKGRVYTADLHLTDNKNVFRKKVVKSLQFIANHNGPYLVHCRVGRDRTGIVILVLESLTGAPYSYILNDYAVSYINIDGFSREKAVQKAKSKIDIHFQELTGKSKKTNWGKLNLAPYTERWLKKGGMTANEISTLKKRLSVSYSK